MSDVPCQHEKCVPKIDISDDELAKLTTEEVRQRYPRFDGQCPDCGQRVIFYASNMHYIAGDY